MADFIVIGGANADIYGHISTSNEISGDSNPGMISIHAGGVGRNIAENLGHLGAKVDFISCLGDDDFADMLKSSLTIAGVSTHLISQVTNAESDAYLAILNASGELISAVNRMMLIETVNADFLSTKHRHQAIRSASIVVLDGNLNISALEQIFSQKPMEQSIAVDAVSSLKVMRFLPYFNQINFFKCNRIEAAKLTNLEDEDDINNMAIALNQRGIETVIVTNGAKGFVVANNQNCVNFPALTAEGGNSSGAGDALFASFLYAMDYNMDIHKAATFAQKAATLTLHHDGPVSSNIAELAKDLI